MAIELGINGVNKKITNIELGIDGIWKQAEKWECGVNGIWKQNWNKEFFLLKNNIPNVTFEKGDAYWGDVVDRQEINTVNGMILDGDMGHDNYDSFGYYARISTIGFSKMRIKFSIYDGNASFVVESQRPYQAIQELYRKVGPGNNNTYHGEATFNIPQADTVMFSFLWKVSTSYRGTIIISDIWIE